MNARFLRLMTLAALYVLLLSNLLKVSGAYAAAISTQMVKNFACLNFSPMNQLEHDSVRQFQLAGNHEAAIGADGRAMPKPALAHDPEVLCQPLDGS